MVGIPGSPEASRGAICTTKPATQALLWLNFAAVLWDHDAQAVSDGKNLNSPGGCARAFV